MTPPPCSSWKSRKASGALVTSVAGSSNPSRPASSSWRALCPACAMASGEPGTWRTASSSQRSASTAPASSSTSSAAAVPASAAAGPAVRGGGARACRSAQARSPGRERRASRRVRRRRRGRGSTARPRREPGRVEARHLGAASRQLGVHAIGVRVLVARQDQDHRLRFQCRASGTARGRRPESRACVSRSRRRRRCSTCSLTRRASVAPTTVRSCSSSSSGPGVRSLMSTLSRLIHVLLLRLVVRPANQDP